MVTPTARFPAPVDGGIDADAWFAAARLIDPDLAVEELRPVLALVSSAAGPEELEFGLKHAELVLELHLDAPSIAAALCYRAVRVDALSLDACERVLSAPAAQLLRVVLRMASVQLLKLQSAKVQTSVASDQLQNVQHMVAALIDDARVAVLKLAERVVALRCAKQARRDRQLRIAAESQRIFAPLAGRLGIWHLKWELEDLALRYLDPLAYRTIAAQLDGRRSERAAAVATVAEAVQRMLTTAGLTAQVSGRAKHICSIWRKMQAKSLSFDQVYDVRAVRVLVPSIAECYTALGLIHTRWKHLPPEFDDYIAVPKENGYRSIHTAVIDDAGTVLEVQIRTREMHREAELGVCAHWAYKTSGDTQEPYAEKMNWLRQTLEWRDTDAWSEGLAELVDSEPSQERVFVSTPDGHVIDLRSGATAIDFAYRIHTEIGHHCVAARADGRVIALNYPLRTGTLVEIVTDKAAQPRIEWLEAGLAIIASARARENIQSWLRGRPKALIIESARQQIEMIRERLALGRLSRVLMTKLCKRFEFAELDEFLLALGAGELPVLEVGDVLLSMALGEEESESAAVDQNARRYALELEGTDREGLLRDVALALSQRQLSILSTEARSDPSTGLARIRLDFAGHSRAELVALLLLLPYVPGVERVRRLHGQ